MDIALDSDNQDIDFLISKVLIRICQDRDFVTVRGNVVTENNVPRKYSGLFCALNELKSSNREGSREILNQILHQIKTQDTFGPIIERFRTFLNECKATVPPSIVSVEAIQTTFYNLMVEQVLTHNYILKDDLEQREAYIFLALSSLVIIASIEYSKNSTGILLCNGGVANLNNCPREYRELVGILFQLKSKFVGLSQDQIFLITLMSLQNSELTIPERLTQLQNTEIMSIVSDIVNISIKISQISHFKNIINNVIEFCIGALN
jgi:hypothetical protein